MRAGAQQQQPSAKKYVRHYMMFQSIAVSQTPYKNPPPPHIYNPPPCPPQLLSLSLLYSTRTL